MQPAVSTYEFLWDFAAKFFPPPHPQPHPQSGMTSGFQISQYQTNVKTLNFLSFHI